MRIAAASARLGEPRQQIPRLDNCSTRPLRPLCCQIPARKARQKSYDGAVAGSAGSFAALQRDFGLNLRGSAAACRPAYCFGDVVYNMRPKQHPVSLRPSMEMPDWFGETCRGLRSIGKRTCEPERTCRAFATSATNGFAAMAMLIAFMPREARAGGCTCGTNATSSAFIGPIIL